MSRKIKHSLPLELAKEIEQALQNLNGWGSVEIFVQDHKIIQITNRAIKKTDHTLNNILSRKEKLRPEPPNQIIRKVHWPTKN